MLQRVHRIHGWLEGAIEEVDVGLENVGFNITFTIGNGMLMF
jgi:hypothetical protein